MDRKKELESREYEVNDLEEDKRFIRCKKETQIIFLVGLIQIVIPTILIYTLNGNEKWFLGLPMWYGVAALFYLCMSAVTIILTIKVIKPHKLGAIGNDEEE